MTVEQLSTSKISSTCPTGVNYISKYAEDLREKSHEVWTWNSNRSRCTAKKKRQGAKMPPPPPPPPHGIRVNTLIIYRLPVCVGTGWLDRTRPKRRTWERDTTWWRHQHSCASPRCVRDLRTRASGSAPCCWACARAIGKKDITGLIHWSLFTQISVVWYTVCPRKNYNRTFRINNFQSI